MPTLTSIRPGLQLKKEEEKKRIPYKTPPQSQMAAVSGMPLTTLKPLILLAKDFTQVQLN